MKKIKNTEPKLESNSDTRNQNSAITDYIYKFIYPFPCQLKVLCFKGKLLIIIISNEFPSPLF